MASGLKCPCLISRLAVTCPRVVFQSDGYAINTTGRGGLLAQPDRAMGSSCRLYRTAENERRAGVRATQTDVQPPLEVSANSISCAYYTSQQLSANRSTSRATGVEQRTTTPARSILTGRPELELLLHYLGRRIYRNTCHQRVTIGWQTPKCVGSVRPMAPIVARIVGTVGIAPVITRPPVARMAPCRIIRVTPATEPETEEECLRLGRNTQKQHGQHRRNNHRAPFHNRPPVSESTVHPCLLGEMFFCSRQFNY